MEKPEFIYGSEKRFYDFISNLGGEKVALISHTDLDGIGSAKVVNSVVNADVIKLVKYEELDENLIVELKKEKVKKVIFSDLYLNEKFILLLEKNFEVLVVDHHPTVKDYNSGKITFLNAQGFCAAYLCYYLFSKVQNVEKLDWLIACSCITDFCYFENAKFMSEVFEKYGDKFQIIEKKIRESGKFWDLAWNLSLALIYFEDNQKRVLDSIGDNFGEFEELSKPIKDVNDYFNETVKRFNKEKTEINGRYLWEFTPKFKVGSLLGTRVSTEQRNKTFIIARIDEKNGLYHFSCRRQDRGEDMNLLVKKMINGFESSDGGGHIPAAAGHILLKDKEKLLERLKKL